MPAVTPRRSKRTQKEKDCGEWNRKRWYPAEVAKVKVHPRKNKHQPTRLKRENDHGNDDDAEVAYISAGWVVT